MAWVLAIRHRLSGRSRGQNTPAARNARGEWQPENLPKPGVLFSWPVEPLAILKFFFGPEGLLVPWNGLYFGLAVVSALFLTPSMERMSSISFDWIALIYLRNAALVTLFAGGLHVRLYIRKAQGIKYKYTDKWPSKRDAKFLFNNQTGDNVFWSLTSGVVVWSAYEAMTLWAYANELLPFIDWKTRPVYFIALLLAVSFMREIHFYWVHRICHWKPIYKISHYLHHKNINVGPWSGLSMHPIEHLLYFSWVLLHWIIPSHPVHAVAFLMHAGLSPAKGHSGYFRFILNSGGETKSEKSIKADDYFHYLHHRFFTVNFGNEAIPLDKWFGSFHDGSPEAHGEMMARRKSSRRSPEIKR